MKKALVAIVIIAMAAGCGAAKNAEDSSTSQHHTTTTKQHKPVHISADLVVEAMGQAKQQQFCNLMSQASAAGLPDSYMRNAFAKGYQPDSPSAPSIDSVFNALQSHCN